MASFIDDLIKDYSTFYYNYLDDIHLNFNEVLIDIQKANMEDCIVFLIQVFKVDDMYVVFNVNDHRTLDAALAVVFSTFVYGSLYGNITNRSCEVVMNHQIVKKLAARSILLEEFCITFRAIFHKSHRRYVIYFKNIATFTKDRSRMRTFFIFSYY